MASFRARYIEIDETGSNVPTFSFTSTNGSLSILSAANGTVSLKSSTGPTTLEVVGDPTINSRLSFSFDASAGAYDIGTKTSYVQQPNSMRLWTAGSTAPHVLLDTAGGLTLAGGAATITPSAITFAPTSTFQAPVVMNNSLSVANSMTVLSTQNSVSLSLAAMVVQGGASIQRNVTVGGVANVGTQLIIVGTTESINPGSGTLITGGGAGIGKQLFVGSTTDASNSTTGALVVKGGIGVAAGIATGGTLVVGSTIDANSGPTGQAALAVAGGVAVAGTGYFQKLKSASTPTAPEDAATKAYVDLAALTDVASSVDSTGLVNVIQSNVVGVGSQTAMMGPVYRTYHVTFQVNPTAPHVNTEFRFAVPNKTTFAAEYSAVSVANGRQTESGVSLVDLVVFPIVGTNKLSVRFTSQNYVSPTSVHNVTVLVWYQPDF